MGAAWALFIWGIVGWIWLDTAATLGAHALSAVQVSQICDEASLTVLCLIAATIALWFAADYHRPRHKAKSSGAEGNESKEGT